MSFITMMLLALFAVLTASTTFEALNGSLQNADIYCGDNEECTVLCEEASGCRYSTIYCPDNAQCSVECTAGSSCRDTEIYCPSDSLCSVHCVGGYSCSDNVIHWSSTRGLGELSCEGYKSCLRVDFPKPDDDTALSVDCTIGGYTCQSAHIHCPLDAQCNVQCERNRGCLSAQIDLPSSFSLYSMYCQHVLSCGGTQLVAVDDDVAVTFDCGSIDNYNCQSQRLSCPDNAHCTVLCHGDAACKNAVVDCPSNGACDISCIGRDSCFETTFNWAATEGLGSIECDGESACSSITFPSPEPLTPYTVLCDSVLECTSSTIICPSDADCIVNCTQTDSCLDAEVVWPTNPNVSSSWIGYPIFFEIVGNVSYQNSVIDCDHRVCSVTCGVQGGCNGATIYCPDHQQCSIDCASASSCRNAEIHCPSTSSCSVSCQRNQACQDSVIHWSDTRGLGSLSCEGYKTCSGVDFPKPDDDTALSVDCSIGGYTCQSAHIHCPLNAQCNVQCERNRGCLSAQIDLPSSFSLYSMYCQHVLSCGSTELIAVDDDVAMTFDCGTIDNYNCQSQILSCPDNADCTVLCHGDEACQSAQIDCPSNGGCHVSCNGTSSCSQATLNWAETGGLGSIECIGESACSSITFPN